MFSAGGDGHRDSLAWPHIRYLDSTAWISRCGSRTQHRVLQEHALAGKSVPGLRKGSAGVAWDLEGRALLGGVSLDKPGREEAERRANAPILRGRTVGGKSDSKPKRAGT